MTWRIELLGGGSKFTKLTSPINHKKLFSPLKPNHRTRPETKLGAPHRKDQEKNYTEEKCPVPAETPQKGCPFQEEADILHYVIETDANVCHPVMDSDTRNLSLNI